jgi:uncharacterized protein (TIGR00369 family)
MRESSFVGSRMMRTPAPTGYGVKFQRTGEGAVEAEFSFDSAKEGPPGFAHGGAVAAVLDEAMGTACFEAGRMGFTVTMTVNYRAAAPLHQPLRVTASVERTEGRKSFTWAALTNHEGQLIADATGIFIMSERLSQAMQQSQPRTDE